MKHPNGYFDWSDLRIEASSAKSRPKPAQEGSVRYVGLLGLITIGPLYLHLSKTGGYGYGPEIITAMAVIVLLQAAFLLRE